LNQKKYLITGGSGFLGINLIRFLLKKDHIITSLDIADFNYPECSQIKMIKGDIRDKDIVEKAMKDINIVVHCAAALPLYSKKDIFSTDVEGTKNILGAALKNNVKRVIQISSTAVYGIPDHHPIYENDKLDRVGHYGEAKVLAEKTCLEYRKRGKCIPILRPVSFIGPERLGIFALFYDWAKDGKGFPMIGNGKNRYQFLDVEDLCEVIYIVATNEPSKVNDTFNIGAKEFTTMKEDYQAVLDYAGFGKKIKTFPAAPMVFALNLLEKLHLSPLYKWVYETASKDSFVSIEKAEKVLGFKPKYSNKDSLIRNYKWYIENLDQFKSQTGISHRIPWKQGILKIAKIFF